MKKRKYECRDCGIEFVDRVGDHCPKCGGADVILIGSADNHE